MYRFITDYSYRNDFINKYKSRTLDAFERDFHNILLNIGSKEIMRIFAPLNTIVNYGGDFESIKNFVERISDIMVENRKLKENDKGTSKVL